MTAGITAEARGAPSGAGVPPVLQRLVGQPRAATVLAASLASPVHAYLFVGPAGTGKRDAALAFAAGLLCPDGGCGACPVCRDVLAGRHADVAVVERHGASISVEEARAVGALAQRSPRFAGRQVLVLVDFHLVGNAAPVLLKTIEEPPASTVFVVLAESRPPSLVTIASRCVEVEFSPLDEAVVEAALVAEGVERVIAAAAAAGAGGRLDRARLLARDSGFAGRQARWRSVPEGLDGTGSTVSVLAAELLAASDELVDVLKARQAEELAAAAEAAERAGERHLPGRQAIEERHKREQRRVRTDELRAGLASLAAAYRSRLDAPGMPSRRVAALLGSCAVLDEAAKSLVRNPNEALLVQALLLSLDRAG